MPDISSASPSKTLSENLRSLSAQGKTAWKARRHLLDTRGISIDELEVLVDLAKAFKQHGNRSKAPIPVLEDKSIATLFFENSTRTRSSFELAAKRLGATVINLDTKVSSVSKGETISDTVLQLVSMNVDAIVQRHSSSGSADHIAHEFGSKVHVINAGDGWHAHPTQALLDYVTMLESRGSLEGAKVTIVGDILHSRVARSNLWLLKLAGADVHIVGPPTLMPSALDEFGVTVHNRLEPGIEGCDFVMALRLQLERQKQGLIPSIGEYTKMYRIDHAKLKLAKPNVKLLHPGPVNRGVEITDQLADDLNISLIREQVTNGVVVRMAVLYLLMAEETDLI